MGYEVIAHWRLILYLPILMAILRCFMNDTLLLSGTKYQRRSWALYFRDGVWRCTSLNVMRAHLCNIHGKGAFLHCYGAWRRLEIWHKKCLAHADLGWVG